MSKKQKLHKNYTSNELEKDIRPNEQKPSPGGVL